MAGGRMSPSARRSCQYHSIAECGLRIKNRKQEATSRVFLLPCGLVPSVFKSAIERSWPESSHPSLIEQMVGGQDQKHVIGRPAAQDVLGLLPEERPHQQFREVRPNQRRARPDAARNIGPVGAVKTVSRGERLRADAGSERRG